MVGNKPEQVSCWLTRSAQAPRGDRNERAAPAKPDHAFAAAHFMHRRDKPVLAPPVRFQDFEQY
jgi:hypothetical protein